MLLGGADMDKTIGQIISFREMLGSASRKDELRLFEAVSGNSAAFQKLRDHKVHNVKAHLCKT